MAKKRRSTGSGGRTTPKGTVSTHRSGSPWSGDLVVGDGGHADDPLAEVAELLHDHPIGLLAHVSGLVATLDPREKHRFADEPDDLDGVDLASMIAAFAAIPGSATAALLLALAALGPDEMTRHRAARAVRQRHDPVPAWLTSLDDATCTRAVQMVHVLGDADNILFGLDLAGTPEGGLTIVVLIDHNLGGLAKDAFVVPLPLAATLAEFQSLATQESGDAIDTRFDDIPLSLARARVLQSLAAAATTWPPFESETWPACRPVLEWALRLLPPAAALPEPKEWDDEEVGALADRFSASSFADGVTSDLHRGALDTILAFATGSGSTDPLQWSPTRVEHFLVDPSRLTLAGTAAAVAAIPAVLRAFIRWAHTERGIRPELTATTLVAVDDWEPALGRGRAGGRGQDPAALLDLLLALDGSDADLDLLGGWGREIGKSQRRDLEAAVGGAAALAALDDVPLPDDPFDWTGIADDIVAMVTLVLAHTDAICDDQLDVEHRTAVRRLLHRAAAGDPKVFRGKAKAENAAVALCWAIGKANGLFQGPGSRTVTDFLSRAGVTSAQSTRALTLLKAAGIPRSDRFAYSPHLGTPALLVSAKRRRLLAARDRDDA